MNRTVKRVLVMLDYGSSDANSGEVFDLTALALEMLPKAIYTARIGFTVEAHRTYAREPDAPKSEVSIGMFQIILSR